MDTQTPETQAGHVPDGELLRAALGAARDTLDAAERTRVHIALRARINDLLPKVQAQMDALLDHSRAWYARDTAIWDAKQELAREISPSPLAACLHLAELGRSLKVLDAFTREES